MTVLGGWSCKVHIRGLRAPRGRRSYGRCVPPGRLSGSV